MNNSKDERVRTVISWVFAFLVFLALSCALLSIGSMFTLFNSAHLENSLEKSCYAEKNFKALESSLRKEAQAHGLPEDLFVKKLDQADFYKRLDSGIHSSAVDPSKDAEQWKRQAAGEVKAYLKKQNVGANQRLDAAAKELIDTAGNYYENYSAFPFAGYFFKYQKQTSVLIKVLLLGSVAASAILIFILQRLQEVTCKGWYYATSALLGAGFVSAIAGFALRFGINYDFSADMAGYEDFLRAFFTGAANVYCAVSSAAVLIVILAFWLIKRHETKRCRI